LRNRIVANAFLSVIVVAGLAATATFTNLFETEKTRSYIVQAADLAQAISSVAKVGGEVTHELGIINSVGALLTEKQVEALRAMAEIRKVFADRSISTAGDSSKNVKSAAPACSVSGEQALDIEGNAVRWTFSNDSDSDIYLEKIMVLWPASNYRLESLTYDNSLIYKGNLYGVSATFTVAAGYAYDSRLRVKAGAQSEFTVGFHDARQEQEPYEIRLFFRKGCSVDFPVPAYLKFSGDSDRDAKRTYVASLIGADALHWQGTTGDGVGVAVIDTGIWTSKGRSNYLVNDSDSQPRITGHYDAIADKVRKPGFNSDKSGHGSHVTSLILSSRYKDSEFNSVAPDANLIAVKAFDENGSGSYSDVIRALDWVVKTRKVYNTRVLNLSFSAEPQSFYWDDPLNQAVMATWQSGIVVVASAGNKGPDPMTIGVPGNLPYVITVGAMTDNVTPMDWSDDTLASFSSAGPTAEAFVKPEIVAPGGHLRGLVEGSNRIVLKHPHFHDGDAYYTMSGTSQAAAVTAGAVALMLQAEPWLTPDQVKCKLMSTARPANGSDGTAAYSIFQQGAGLIDVEAAISGTAYNCANNGLDIAADLAGTEHFRGQAEQDENGSYYVASDDGHVWDGGYGFTDGHVWSRGLLWNDGMIWSDGIVWNDGMVWSDGLIWNDGVIQPVSINVWVDQE